MAQAAEKENGKQKGLDPAGVERLKEQHRRTRPRQHLDGNRRRRASSASSPASAAISWAPSRARRARSRRPSSASTPGIFGLRGSEAELQVSGERTDELGGRHVSYAQTYRGVPGLRGHAAGPLQRDGELTSVNGNVIPEIRVNPDPTRTAAEAAAAAIAAVGADNAGRDVYARSGLLMVYRTDLARGIEGENHLTYQIEVGNGADIREFVYVDAHSGKIVDRLPGIVDAMFRRAYDGAVPSRSVPPSLSRLAVLVGRGRVPDRRRPKPTT